MPGYPLEPDADDLREMAAAAATYLQGFVEGLSGAPADNVDGSVLAAEKLHGPMPPTGRAFAHVLAEFDAGVSSGHENAGPGFLAFIPGGGLVTAALATYLAATVNRFVNMAASAPAFVQIEQDVLRWFCDLFELPEGSGGILTSGGSMANLSAIVTARTALLPEQFLDGTLYVSSQAHASIAKAAALAGFPASRIRTIPVDERLGMDVGTLRDTVRRDRAAGRTPFFVVATAGTTNTGTVDPLPVIASVCAAEGIWFHVDAAYGGFFQVTDRGRSRFAGIERADSITLDPHKGLFLPYGTGSLLVRDAALLRAAHLSGAPYLQDVATGAGVLPNMSEYSPELSREFRGLRVWLPLQLHGVDAFREALDEKLDLAELVDRELRSIPGIEVPWSTELSVVCFRVARDHADADDADELGRRLLERINASRRVFLSSTVIDGRYILRVAILSHRTHRDRIDELLDIVRDAAAEVLDARR